MISNYSKSTIKLQMDQRVITFDEILDAALLLDQLVVNKINKETYLHLYDGELD